jgi:hypothetical protein
MADHVRERGRYSWEGFYERAWSKLVTQQARKWYTVNLAIGLVLDIISIKVIKVAGARELTIEPAWKATCWVRIATALMASRAVFVIWTLIFAVSAKSYVGDIPHALKKVSAEHWIFCIDQIIRAYRRRTRE